MQGWYNKMNENTSTVLVVAIILFSIMFSLVFEKYSTLKMVENGLQQCVVIDTLQRAHTVWQKECSK